MIEELISIRRHLHANPELSGEEINTAAWITDFLLTLNPDYIKTGIGGNGILCLFDSGKPGKTLLFRTEIDALPIREVNSFNYKSTVEGVSHKCGHDGHAAIMMGLAKRLDNQRPASGKVYLLFQPAEETGEGAKRVTEDKQFNISPDYVFALHNIPGFPVGEIIIKEGLFTAAVNSLIIRLAGKEAHAAEPETGINPAIAMSEIIMAADALNQSDVTKTDFQLITPVFMQLGNKAYGTSAGAGEVHFTLRSWSNEILSILEKNILEAGYQIAQKHRLAIQHEFVQTFFANQNDKEATALVKNAAQQLQYHLTEKEFPFQWGEDFGYLTSRYKGCMFGIGVGEKHPALHNPDYDFPDDVLMHGVSMFHKIIQLVIA